eukprot:8755191-Pyramimonas_sp.AAC.1
MKTTVCGARSARSQQFWALRLASMRPSTLSRLRGQYSGVKVAFTSRNAHQWRSFRVECFIHPTALANCKKFFCGLCFERDLS